jgi:hypothetical protein
LNLLIYFEPVKPRTVPVLASRERK